MYSIDPSSVLDIRAFIAMLIVLVPLSVMILWLRIKGWGVEFTPTGIIKSLFSKNSSCSEGPVHGVKKTCTQLGGGC